MRNKINTVEYNQNIVVHKLPPDKLDSLKQIEALFIELTSNNKENKPIKLITYRGFEYDFKMPLELKAFAKGIEFGMFS